MRGKDDDVLAKKAIFWLGKTLEGDNLTKSGFSRVDIWCELRLRFVKLGGKSGLGIVLSMILRKWSLM